MSSHVDPPQKEYLYASLLFEDFFLESHPEMDRSTCFARFIKHLKYTISAPWFSEDELTFCASKIRNLYPHIKPEEQTELGSLANRIRVWDEISSDPAIRLAKLATLPTYQNNKIKLIQDLLAILSFEDDLACRLMSFNNTLMPYLADEVPNEMKIAEFKALITPPADIAERLKTLVHIFPYLEFIRESEPGEEISFRSMPIFATIINQLNNFFDAHRKVLSDQIKFKNYLFSLLEIEKAFETAERKEINRTLCSSEPSYRIASLATLKELEDLVKDLLVESSLMGKIEAHLSFNKRITGLFTSKNKNSYIAHYKANYPLRGYLLSKSDFAEHPTLAKHEYIKHGNPSNGRAEGHYLLHLNPFNVKTFNYKTISKSLDLLISTSHSSNLNAILQSMKDHIELIRLAQSNNIESDLQTHIKSLKTGTVRKDLTPFLHDTLELIKFFPAEPLTIGYCIDPTPSKFSVQNQILLEKTLERWNESKDRQHLLLEHTRKVILAFKKAKKSGPTKTSKSNTNRQTEKTTKTLTVIARAVIEGRVREPTRLREFYQPCLQVGISLFPRSIRSLMAPPPGSPFAYQKAPHVLKWENHPVGKALTFDIFQSKYTKLSPLAQEKIHLFHAPHPAVDLFLHLGIQGRFGKNKRIEIMTEIQFNKKTFRGVIGYTFEGDTCTHKCFTSNENEMLKQAWKKLQEHKSLALKTVASPLSPKTRYPDLRCYISQDALGNVRIEDTRRDLIIKLFKT